MSALRCTAATSAVLLLGAACALAQEGPPPAGAGSEGPGLDPPAARRQEGLVLSAPATWQAAPARAGEQGRWLLPPAAGPAAGPASAGAPLPPRLAVVLVRLGGTRPLAQHLARWARAYQRAERAPLDPATLEARPLEIEGVPCQVVELQGTYALPPYPGAEDWAPRPGWAGLRAVLDGPDGQWTVTLDGPAEAVIAARAQWLAFLRTAKPGLVEVKDPAEAEAERGEKRGETSKQE